MDNLQIEITRLLLLHGARIVYEWDSGTRYYRCSVSFAGPDPAASGFANGESMFEALCGALIRLTKPRS